MKAGAEEVENDDRRSFQKLQDEHFASADGAKYFWQTGDAYLARTERDLLDCVQVGTADRLLEIGCGEGGNLKLMKTAGAFAVGLDYSSAKTVWAMKHIPQARFVCADATRLPFHDGSFDIILCRDVLHHVLDKAQVVHEIMRVCRASGRIVIIEPNGRSPIMWLFGLLVRAERDLMRNSYTRLDPFLDRRFVMEPDVRWAQPFPLGRVLFHYRWGLPCLSGWLAGAVLLAERVIGMLIPSDRWAYIIITTVKGASDGTRVAARA